MSVDLCMPHQITQIRFGLWGSKTRPSAIGPSLFTELANGPLDASALGERLGLYALNNGGFCRRSRAIVAQRTDHGLVAWNRFKAELATFINQPVDVRHEPNF